MEVHRHVPPEHHPPVRPLLHQNLGVAVVEGKAVWRAVMVWGELMVLLMRFILWVVLFEALRGGGGDV